VVASGSGYGAFDDLNRLLLVAVRLSAADRYRMSAKDIETGQVY
jgi:hypothetical protein